MSGAGARANADRCQPAAFGRLERERRLWRARQATGSATLACVFARAMGGAICFRNFSAPRICDSVIVLSLGPTIPGALLAGEPLPLVLFLQIPNVSDRHDHGVLQAQQDADRDHVCGAGQRPSRTP